MLSAYLLISHGSSDPRHEAGLLRLAGVMRQHLDRQWRQAFQTASMAPQNFAELHQSFSSSPYSLQAQLTESWSSYSSNERTHVPSSLLPIVGTATLEAAKAPLAEQIEAFAKQVMRQGVRQIIIVPLFLLAGIHVQEDLPEEIAKAESSLPPQMRLLCLPHLGSLSRFKQFVAARLKATTADRCLLLAHGSRRPAGNRSVRQLGAILDADVAFWSVPPDLETQVVELMQQGYQHIAIAPYFLFPGGITDAITRQTEDLAERLPRLSLRLLAPLGTSTHLGKVVAEMVVCATPSVSMQSWNRNRKQMAGNSMTA